MAEDIEAQLRESLFQSLVERADREDPALARRLRKQHAKGDARLATYMDAVVRGETIKQIAERLHVGMQSVDAMPEEEQQALIAQMKALSDAALTFTS